MGIMNYSWIEIQVKHAANCIECGKAILEDQTALWMQGLGIKHVECPTGILEEDKSQLVIIEKDDEKLLNIDGKKI